MKNKMIDLNNILFEQLERLQDDELMEDNEKFNKEVERSKAVAGISSQIIKNAQLTFQAAKLAAEYGDGNVKQAVAGLIGTSGND